MIRRIAAAVLTVVGFAIPASAAHSFVYVAVAPPPCSAPCAPGPLAPGQLLVFDSVTGKIVTTAPLGTSQNVPQGIAIAPDGRRLYISMLASDGSASLVVFDTTLHQMKTTYPITPAAAGAVAVTRDNQRVFIAGGISTGLVVWDTQTTSVTAVQPGTYRNLFAHPAFTRVVASIITSAASASLLEWVALDEVTGAVLTSTSAGLGLRASMSPDGSLLYNTKGNTMPSSGGSVTVHDPLTFQETGTVPCPGCFPELTLTRRGGIAST